MTIALIIPGHTVVLHADGTFRPSDLIQEVVWGENWRFVRTGIHNPNLTPQSPDAYLGGGDAVVRAAAAWTIAHATEKPHVFIVAGSAAYLDKAAQGYRMDADLPNCEAIPMKELFSTLPSSNPPVTMITTTRTTEDDMECGLEAAQNAGCSKAVFLMMEFRLGRSMVLMHHVVSPRRPDLELPHLFESADNLYVESSADLQSAAAMLHDAYHSRAGAATNYNELFGIKRALAGTHARGGKT